LGWCRKCGENFWPDSQPGWQPPTEDELEKWRREREREELAKKQAAERALAHLRSGRIWEQYHAMLQSTADGRAFWRGKGIPDVWQEIWNLGWNPEYSIMTNDGEWTTPSATIPIFATSASDPVNVKHRLVNVPSYGGKYRYEISGFGAPLFLTDRDKAIQGNIIAIEGEIKAMVTYLTLDDSSANIVGLPGLNPSQTVLDELSLADSVTLITDPGSEPQAWEIVKAIGRDKCRVCIAGLKIDDAIRAGAYDAKDVKRLLAQARVY